MHELGLISGILAMSSVGLMGLIRPLRLNRWYCAMIAGVLVFSLLIAYAGWGMYAEWHNFLQLQYLQQAVKTRMASREGRNELIQQLRARLTQQPENAYGWVLLAKLYASVGEQTLAREALATAEKLSPA